MTSVAKLLSTKTTTPTMKTTTINRYHSLIDAVNHDDAIEIEHKEGPSGVKFHPNMDWKLETKKSEQGHLRRLAEREIRKLVLEHKQQKQQALPVVETKSSDEEVLPTSPTSASTSTVMHSNASSSTSLLMNRSRSERLHQAFLYYAFGDIDLLVQDYKDHHSNTMVLAKMVDRLWEDAGIKTLEQRSTVTTATTTAHAVSITNDNASSSWLWTSFLALQLEYRRIYDATDAAIVRASSQQALVFLHWLSPVFATNHQESRQRNVHKVLLEDVVNFRDYVINDNGNNEQLEVLRKRLHAFFESTLGVPSSSLHEPLSTTSRQIDLGVYFATVRNTRENGTEACDWSCNECSGDEDSKHQDPKERFAYKSLSQRSKEILFGIGILPAFLSYTKQRRSTEAQDKDPSFVVGEEINSKGGLFSPSSWLFPGFSLGWTDEDEVNDKVCENGNDKKDGNDDCDCSALLSQSEYDFVQEACNLLFDGSSSPP